MLRSIEPSMKTVEVVRLYRETLDMEANAEDIDRMSPEAFCQMAEEKQRKPHKRVFEIIDKERKGMITRDQF